MKRIIALAAFAVSLSAFAAGEKHSWFDILSEWQSIESWPTDGSDYEGYKCVVTNTAAATYVNSNLCFNAEAPMAVLPDSVAPITEISYAKVKATMKMEPFLESDVPAVPEGAKTAAIAVISGSQTNFWVAAGIDELFWTNTCVAADVTTNVEVEVTVTYGMNCVNTQWNLGGTLFNCKIATVSELHGVNFLGQGSFVECWGDAETYGSLVDFWISGIPTNVFVTVTTTNGSELVKTDLGVYRYISGGKVNLAFVTPDGWRYFDGTNEWFDVIAEVKEGEYTPFSNRGPLSNLGIAASDLGPINGWMVLKNDGSVLHFSTLDEALDALKDGSGLSPCYSETGHEFDMAPDGKSITVDGVNKPAKNRYHYEIVEFSPVLKIDDGEADITSIGEDSSDPTKMSVGSIENSYSDFYYSVIYGDDVGLEINPGSTDPIQGNGAKLELKAPKGDNGKRFYRIRITD